MVLVFEPVHTFLTAAGERRARVPGRTALGAPGRWWRDQALERNHGVIDGFAVSLALTVLLVPPALRGRAGRSLDGQVVPVVAVGVALGTALARSRR